MPSSPYFQLNWCQWGIVGISHYGAKQMFTKRQTDGQTDGVVVDGGRRKSVRGEKDLTDSFRLSVLRVLKTEK